MKIKNDLTSGPIDKTLLRLTIPMVAGFAATMSFNLVDTLFVAQLGTIPLAAMTFTFPVAMLVISFSVGISMGTASVISQAYGKRDITGVRRLSTASLLLGLVIAVVFVTAGLFTIVPIFTLLGATPDIIPIIGRYMIIWYIGVPFIVVTMLGGSAIRATGDTKIPGVLMIIGAILNMVLDPIMIYGLFGFPRMELAGAALATTITQGISFVLILLVMTKRVNMIDFSGISFSGVRRSWGEILAIGLPTTGTNLLFPLSMAFVTWLASRFGPEGVAAVGAGLRIEMFAFIVIIGLSSALVPFVGQNWGAEAFERVHEAQARSNRFTFWWGIFCWVLFLILSRPIARLFSDDQTVIRYIRYYLWIMPAGLSTQGVFMLISGTFNAMGRPLISAAMSVLRVFVFYLPLTWAGTVLFGFSGMIGGIAVTNVITGTAAIFLFRRICVHDELCIKKGERAVPSSGE
ncbi:MAG: MATE family efflux transporter [Deltaproteobacteria bacterium]|nr:MATE family efflux transporter [Candidatus Zymogenaceae bacterium]